MPHTIIQTGLGGVLSYPGQHHPPFPKGVSFDHANFQHINLERVGGGIEDSSGEGVSGLWCFREVSG